MASIHVFFHQLEEPFPYKSSGEETLPITILKKIKQYNPSLQLPRLASYLLLKKALALLKLPSDLTKLEISIGKKPIFIGVKAPHFSISHSGSLVVVAICQMHPVGIDIEEHRKLLSEFLEEKGFDPSEDTSAAINFFDAWTRREASIKCLGITLSEENTEKLWLSPSEALAEKPKIFTQTIFINSSYSASFASPVPIEVIIPKTITLFS